jgi:malate permease and related proteins
LFIVQDLLPIFLETVLPVFLVAGAGYLLARSMKLDGRTLGRMLFYLATPALVFRSLYQMELSYAALGQTAIVVVGVVVAAGLLGFLAGYDQDRRHRAALVLTSAISNNGNMGISICFFAFGQPGLALGSIYYVISSFLGNTLGVVVASAGERSIASALKNSLRVPVLYATIAGLALNSSGIELPVSLFRAVDLLANAAIPGMLVLLGMQLQSATLFREQSVVLRSAAICLLAAPLVAWQLCLLLGVAGVTRNVLILQAAMPTATMSAVLATEYDTAPALVATVILFTTLASMVTLSFLLWLLL